MKTSASATGSALCAAAAVDGDDHRLRAETAADLFDQLRMGDCGGVDADLVRARIEDCRGVVERANSAADGEGDKQLTRGALHGFDQRAASLVGGGDVEQDDLVRARLGMGDGKRRRVAGVD